VSEGELQAVMNAMAAMITENDWDRIGDVFHEDAVLEFPQSGERFRGIANIRAQWENYPNLNPGTSEVREVIGDAAYALTPSYTVIRIEGTGLKGTAVIRIRYPDGSYWWAINLYEIRDGRMSRSRSYFAPDFEAPDWRAPYREAP
jgi:ketosteroid isomerase-like protein